MALTHDDEMIPYGRTTIPVSPLITKIDNSWNADMTLPPHKEFAIQGQMLTVKHVISDIEWAQRVLTPEEIKTYLTQLMAEEMYRNNCIEFTKQQDNLSGNYLFHARIFVVPDTQVRILRTLK